MLGRPLQPNPAGGPPTVPQALNRYAATPLGQPGVAEGAINGGGFNLLSYLPYAASSAKIWAYDFHYSPQIGQALAHVMPRRYTVPIAYGVASIELRSAEDPAKKAAFGTLLGSLSGEVDTSIGPLGSKRLGAGLTSFWLRIPISGTRLDFTAEAEGIGSTEIVDKLLAVALS